MEKELKNWTPVIVLYDDNFSENVLHAAHLIINKHHHSINGIGCVAGLPYTGPNEFNDWDKWNFCVNALKNIYVWKCVWFMVWRFNHNLFWRCSKMPWCVYLWVYCLFALWITWKNTFQAETKREVDVWMWKCLKIVNINGSFECMINSLMGNHRYLMPDIYYIYSVYRVL